MKLKTSRKLTQTETLALSILRDDGSIVIPDEKNVALPAIKADGSLYFDPPSRTQITFKRRTIENLIDRGLITASPTIKCRVDGIQGDIARLTESGAKRAKELGPTEIFKTSTKFYRGR